MDSFWQQHRSFILKILAGLLVAIVCWAIGSSLVEKSLGDRKAELDKRDASLASQRAPSDPSLAELGSKVDLMDGRVRGIAQSIGYTARPEDPESRDRFRREVLGRILKGIGYAERTRLEFENALKEQIEKARANPIGCVIGLKGEAKDYLLREAARKNIRVDEDLGFGRETLEADEIDRYLVALSVIVHVVNLAIAEEIYDVDSIQIRAPTEVEAEVIEGPIHDPEDVTVVPIGARYPVGFTVRAPSAVVLRFLEELNRPLPGFGEGMGAPGSEGSVAPGILALEELTNMAKSQRTRREDDDLMQASFIVKSLVIDLDAEVGE